MKQMVFYLLQVMLCSGILYGYYILALRNKRFHQYNRFYLLFAVVLSFVIPLLEFKLTPNEITGVDYQVLQNILIKSYRPADTISLQQQLSNWLLNNAVMVVYVTVAALVLSRFVYAVYKLYKTKKKYKAERLQQVQLFRTQEPGTPYSFFNWLFWDSRIALESEKGKQIFKHELYHIQQKHSWDIVLMELVCTVCWVNPFFHVIRKELATIHEFLADKYASVHSNKWDYAEMLVTQAIIAKQQRIVHPFFQNQIKRRIAMITNVNKTSFLYARKLLVLPMLLLMVAFFAINCTNDDAGKDKTTAKDTLQEITIEKVNVKPNDSITEITIVEEKTEQPPPPPKIEEKKFIPPKVVKDEEVMDKPKVEMKKFTPPKVVKDEDAKKSETLQLHKPIYEKVEVEAMFPGGPKAWENFLRRNLNANVPVDKGAPAGRYTIYVQFIVDENGNVSELKPITSHGFGMEKEAIRVLKKATKWVPANDKGKVVAAYRKQPITFVIENE